MIGPAVPITLFKYSNGEMTARGVRSNACSTMSSR